jgi:hypothetical protein
MCNITSRMIYKQYIDMINALILEYSSCNRRMPEGSRRDHRYQNKGARDERIVG